MIECEVCYAGPEGQFVVPVRIADGATIGDAIDASAIRAKVPALVVTDRNVGVFAQLRPLSTPVAAGDRIEIYRPLVADPKDVRRERAARETGRRK